MQLTKYTHSCVRIDEGDRSLVIDPGVFSEVAAALDGAGAVLVTHEHFDHLNVDEVRAALERDSRLELYAPRSVAAQFEQFGEQVHTVEPGQALEVAGFPIRTFGGQHAVIHPSIPVIENVGYLVGDAVYHPGDAFTVPTAPVQVLLAPIHAPWSKLSEVIDFAIAVRAPRTLNLHDSLLNQNGLGVVEAQLGRIAGAHGTEYTHLAPAETIDV